MSEKNATDPLIVEQLSPDTQWLHSTPEQALSPARLIVDPHHHFSEHWGGYGLDELLADTGGGHHIEATVFMQCGWNYSESGPERLKPLGETRAVVRLAEQAEARGVRTRVAAGIVGYADLTLGAAAEEILLGHVEAGKGRFRGVRVSAVRHDAFKHGVLPRPPAGLYADKSFREGVALLGKLGLSFDAWVYHTQIHEVVELARAVPGTTIVLDHVGGILGVGPYDSRRDAAAAEWRQAIAALADCPNVVFKLGGYGIGIFGYTYPKQPVAPSSEQLANDWRPSVEHLIERFGARRCMFESNFPVDRASASYVTVWNAFKRLGAGFSPSEQDALFRETAKLTYRLDL